jgi:hypothetical protein
MKSLSISLLLLLASPAHAQDTRRSLTSFCEAIVRINRAGQSAAPGSPSSMFIVARSNQTSSDYRMVWGYALASDISSCRTIW